MDGCSCHMSVIVIDETQPSILLFRGRQVLKSEGIVNLLNLESSQQLTALPSVAKRGLIKALVLVGSACEDQASRDQYWMRVLNPLSEKFNAIIQHSDLKKIYNDDKVRGSIESLLESFIGEHIFEGDRDSLLMATFD